LEAFSHAHRIRISAELRGRELDVNALQPILGISHAGVSQNLSVPRARRLVQERRAGRRVIDSLARQELAEWIPSAPDAGASSLRIS
jgi:predicted transcriptional regulator